MSPVRLSSSHEDHIQKWWEGREELKRRFQAIGSCATPSQLWQYQNDVLISQLEVQLVLLDKALADYHSGFIGIAQWRGSVRNHVRLSKLLRDKIALVRKENSDAT